MFKSSVKGKWQTEVVQALYTSHSNDATYEYITCLPLSIGLPFVMLTAILSSC